MEANTHQRGSAGPIGILVTWQPTTRIHTSKNVIHADFGCGDVQREFTLGCPLLSARYTAATKVRSKPNQISGFVRFDAVFKYL